VDEDKSQIPAKTVNIRAALWCIKSFPLHCFKAVIQDLLYTASFTCELRIPLVAGMALAILFKFNGFILPQITNTLQACRLIPYNFWMQPPRRRV